VALDLLPIEAIEGVRCLRGDFRDSVVLAELEGVLAGRPVDVLLSDMAPNLSGVADADAARMADLVELALDFAVKHLSPQGVFLCKVFQGGGFGQLVQRFKSSFRLFKTIKPKASRSGSAETYLIGIGPKSRERAA
jgi:23S rRNA (uridine2552-2'-O)-methyltransferase